MSEPLSDLDDYLNDVTRRWNDATGGPELSTFIASELLAEVRRLRELLKHANWRIAELCESNLDLAFDERDAARADLARAIELLKRDHWSRRAADCACNTCTFLAEMGKR